MDIVVYSQYYRTRTPDRQLEIDECLRRNLNHPGINRVVLFCETDAPPVPQGTVPVEVVTTDERITYAEWFRWVQRQGTGIGLLLNADIYLDQGLEHLVTTFDRADTFVALTRYNPGNAGFHLNDYPHWTQDVWGVRADAELPESLIYASSFPLGFPGCDNRIAYVMWSHGFSVRNPCYHVRSVHLQASTARHYDKTSDRLYGGVTYVHPSLSPNEEAELEFTLWTRSPQRPAGVLINQQAIEQGVHQLRHGEAEVAQGFLDQQKFTGLSWMHEALGSAHLEGNLHHFASEDTIFLPMPALMDHGACLSFQDATSLEGLSLRLPKRAPEGYFLELHAENGNTARLDIEGRTGVELKGRGARLFWQSPEFTDQHWNRLRLKLVGPPADPAWQDEEGAELVVFGSEGSLSRAKSLNVIAEDQHQVASNAALEPLSRVNQKFLNLRTVLFADATSTELKNLINEQTNITAPDGTATCSTLLATSEDALVKYAFNTYISEEPGTYTATLILKTESQTKIVLRINDQTGFNDARQAFDLVAGTKMGAAVNGGTATGAYGEIQSLGDGWHKCAITATFHDPVTLLQGPSLWFEHYAPSSSTGRVFTWQAEILRLSDQPCDHPVRSAECSSENIISKPREEDRLRSVPSAPDLLPYRWQRRSDFSQALDNAVEIHCYGNRFRILRHADELIFDDRFWPSLGISQLSAVPYDLDDRRGMFLWGFCQPTLVLRPDFIANTKRFPSDVNFWQYPCRTEGDAFAVHQSLTGPQVQEGIAHIFVGLPWATWIDRQAWPTTTFQAIASRLRKLRQELEQLGVGLKVHSVCQHIFWREHLHQIKGAGVECLWLSHQPPGQNTMDGVELRAWHLYPVNAREIGRRKELKIKQPTRKPWLATFVGAHMDHYITDVRPKLLQFKDLHRFHVVIKDEWHFNPIVYGEQVEDNLFRNRSTKVVEDDFIRYNRILSDSQFSLCPAGAGPNSLRLWESLAVGSIPVILSDRLVLPNLSEISGCLWHNWEEIVIFHPETELESLPERLEAISIEEIEQRSTAGIALMEQVNRFTCLGVASGRMITPVEEESDQDQSKPQIVIPVYGPTDRYFWRQKKHGFYNVVLEWYFRGYVSIEFGCQGYFWWGQQGDVLLMERDNVRDLVDRKKDPPRWQGEVPYKYAFFFNQYHLLNGRNLTATYFTYTPEHLEKVRTTLGRLSYKKRIHASIFAGSIENEVQEYFRNRFRGWDEYIEIYSCADKLNHKESHRYGVDEYLQLLASSKFGVSFRGNGPKCFRELEYLAFGTPLIITEGIEVNYPDPLVEGVHFFRAYQPEDIQRIAESTSEEKWEQMSQACWDWFERNGTIDRMFEKLVEEIDKLDLNAQRYNLVRISVSRDQAGNSLAARSLAIFDPNAQWIAEDEQGETPLRLKADELVVNELPFAGQEKSYIWKLESKDHRTYTESILNSELNVNKRLLELLGLRMRNFKVSIEGGTGKEISVWDRLENCRIVLQSNQEKAILQSDYDWSRRCNAKYVDRQVVINGPGPISFPIVEATLNYTNEHGKHSASLSDHFNDFYAMHDALIPEATVIKTCKLWEYGNAKFNSISGIVSSECGIELEFNYHNLK